MLYEGNYVLFLFNPLFYVRSQFNSVINTVMAVDENNLSLEKVGRFSCFNTIDLD
jgi:hypothetical protein